MNRWFPILALLATAFAGADCFAADDLPLTGQANPLLGELDAWMQTFLTEHKIPGGALAIVKDGKLVHARGFGWADRDAKEKVEPESLFRIASVSKPLTA